MLRETALTVDAAAAQLHSSGWSADDMAFQHNGRLIWQVYAHRDKQELSVARRRRPKRGVTPRAMQTLSIDIRKWMLLLKSNVGRD